MAVETIRVGIVGLGANTRLRHVPGLRECEGVEITGVCNRSPESTQKAAAEFNIPKTYPRWEDLVADDDLDAVVIGTWPYLHAPITLAALAAGKHVLTEARMAASVREAHEMLAASRKHPQLVTQIVPSPLGLRADTMIKDLLSDNYLGELREVILIGTSDALVDPQTPLHWRQQAHLSGINMLTLGILHESLTRWIPQPVRVLAQTATFISERHNPATDTMAPVETPDVAHVLAEFPGGALGIYHLSGMTRFGPGTQIHLYGSDATLKYQLAPEERLLGGRAGNEQLREIRIPPKKVRHWRVEADFIDAIRGKQPIELTDFETGVKYMEFTEAVAKSAQTGQAVTLPL